MTESLERHAVGGRRRGRTPTHKSLLGATVLPVEHTIRRWRVEAGQHASQTTCGRTARRNDAIPIRGGENIVRAVLRKGATPRMRDGFTRRQVEFEPPISHRRCARVDDGEEGDETVLPRR